MDEQITRLDLVTIDQAAEILGMHRNSIRWRAENGELEGARLNGGKGPWVFRREEVLKGLE